jgi:hypothetical protein
MMLDVARGLQRDRRLVVDQASRIMERSARGAVGMSECVVGKSKRKNPSALPTSLVLPKHYSLPSRRHCY